MIFGSITESMTTNWVILILNAYKPEWPAPDEYLSDLYFKV